jgi:hypothetical protein
MILSLKNKLKRDLKKIEERYNHQNIRTPKPKTLWMFLEQLLN